MLNNLSEFIEQLYATKPEDVGAHVDLFHKLVHDATHDALGAAGPASETSLDTLRFCSRLFHELVLLATLANNTSFHALTEPNIPDELRPVGAHNACSLLAFVIADVSRHIDGVIEDSAHTN